MAATETAPAQAKGSKKPLILGAVLALVLGGGSFHAVRSGMILGQPTEAAEAEIEALPEIGFVPIEPLVISLGQQGDDRHLRFSAQLEVAKGFEDEVRQMLPRVVDVLNTYLRAVELAELEDPTALVRLRAQMLRRIRIVTGEGRVRDLLIMEFVLT